MHLARAAWDVVAAEAGETESVALDMAEQSCLTATIQVVDYVESLTWTDLSSYWPHCWSSAPSIPFPFDWY